MILDPLTAARAQMEVSLAFHMIFAALGIAMPALMLIAEGLWLRTGQRHYRDIAFTWGKATALTFAVGAVSGTALSFELGLLWPRFMAFAGSTVGPAFALEGFAFFIEAVFIGIYLYGWDRLSPRAHWLAGFPVAISGLASGVLVVAVNAWMQMPPEIDPAGPSAPFRSVAWFHMAVHSSIACYAATALAVAGVYALALLRGNTGAYERSALRISMVVATIASVLQPITGDVSARSIAGYQPVKLAAMEALQETQSHAPLTIGGIPQNDGSVKFGVRIPSGLSLLVHHTPRGVVRGLNEVAPQYRPNVLAVHIAFQIMVGLGFTAIGLCLLFWWLHRRKAERNALRAALLASPMGFLALEAGWIVTEVGRQPWMVYNVFTTAQGVTPITSVTTTFFMFTLLYLALGAALVVLLRGLSHHVTHHVS